MDHKQALQTMAAEKYLLGELAPETRDEFEDHYFSCEDCAQDIVAGTALLEQGKTFVLRERQAAAAVPQREVTTATGRAGAERKDWFAWLRPAFAVPAFALLLLVIGFQNFVQLPGLERSLGAANAPGILPSVYLTSGGTRGDDKVVVAGPGELFQLTIDVPESSGVALGATLYDSGGREKRSFPLPEGTPRDGLALKMPGDLPAGGYSLVVRRPGPAASGEVARYTFTLHRQ